MALKAFEVDPQKFITDKTPDVNLCYFLADVGTIWLQGKTASGQADSRATFVWYHQPGDIDAHSQILSPAGHYAHEPVGFWHYRMQTRDEDGGETPVDLLIAEQEDEDVGGYPVYYSRKGIEKEHTYVLWTWNVKMFLGHEDSPAKAP